MEKNYGQLRFTQVKCKSSLLLVAGVFWQMTCSTDYILFIPNPELPYFGQLESMENSRCLKETFD